MRYILFYCFLLLSAFHSSAQDDWQFTSPVKHKTRLSGSYGEPRTAHFHAGIDYKQYRGVPRDTIFAVGPGYISRISINPDGYGNALYIDHPNGYTSVYAHLYDFNPSIRTFINKVLYKNKIHALNYDAKKDSLLVNHGDYIGIMGNTGRSSAAHLHFEVRETETETPVNPSKFGFKPIDTQIPIVRGIMIYQIGPDAEIYSKKYYPVKLNKDSIYIPEPYLIQVGSVAIGIGVHCYDTMNGAKNHNGIYGLKTQLNGRDHFAFELNQISFDNSKYIHSHMDYEAKLKNKYISKSFKTPDNPLKIYDTSLGNGFILPSEGLASRVDIAVYDYEKNQAKIQFQIVRKEQLDTIPLSEKGGTYRLDPTDTLSINTTDFDINFPKLSVDKPEYINVTNIAQNEITIEAQSSVAFFKYFQLSNNKFKQADCNKCIYIGEDSKGKATSYGSRWDSDSTIVCYVDEIGTYRIGQDTVPPSIKIVSLPTLNRGQLAFIISDNYTPAYKRDYLKFEVLVNEEWVLCQHDIKTNKVWCYPRLIPGKNTITIRVKDALNNLSIARREVEI